MSISSYVSKTGQVRWGRHRPESLDYQQASQWLWRESKVIPCIGPVVAIAKYLTKAASERTVYPAHSSRTHRPSWRGRHGSRSMRQLVTWHPQSGSGEGWMLGISSPSPSYSAQDPSQWDGGHPYSEWVFSPQLTWSGNPTDMTRGVSPSDCKSHQVDSMNHHSCPLYNVKASEGIWLVECLLQSHR